MAAQKPPAFQFYPADFLSDANVLAMSLDAIGAYWLLLSVCWLEHGLEDDLDKLARIMRASRANSDANRANFDELWRQVGPCFYVSGGRWQHKRLDAERAKQRAFNKKATKRGRAGAAKRWGALSMPQALIVNASSMPDDGSLSSSSSSIVQEGAEAITKQKEPGRGLAFGGQGLSILRWQHDEFCRRLVGRDFDLSGWYLAIDAAIVAGDVTLPAAGRERFDWLLHRLHADAKIPTARLLSTRDADEPRRHIPDAEATRAYLARVRGSVA